MYCTNCGTQMAGTHRFCAQCGKDVGGPEPAQRTGAYTDTRGRTLDRDIASKKIAGVCAGIARHYGWDVTLVRVAFLASVLAHGLGVIAYLIAWICMPRDDLRTVVQTQRA